MAYTRRIAIVCCYTCKPVDQVPEVKEYFDDIINDIIRTRTTYLVPCGGPTFQRSYPGMTEARRAAEYIVPRVPFKLLVHMEEDSFTTYDNIKGATAILAKFPKDGKNEITAWCEATRALKVDILTRHFMPRPEDQPRIRIKTSSWERAAPLKELVGTFKDWAATKLPFLNAIQRAQRMALARVR